MMGEHIHAHVHMYMHICIYVEQVCVMGEKLRQAEQGSSSAVNLARERDDLLAGRAQLTAANERLSKRVNDLQSAGATGAEELSEHLARLAELEAEIAQCNEVVDQAVAEISKEEELPMGSVSAGSRRDQPTAAQQAAIDKALNARIKGLGSSAIERIRSVVANWKAAEGRAKSLEETLASIRLSIKESGSVSVEVRRWRSEAERQRLIVMRCQERVGTVVPYGVGQPPPPLPLMIEKVLDKYKGLGNSLDKMHDQLSEASEAVQQLQLALERAEDVSNSRVHEVRSRGGGGLERAPLERLCTYIHTYTYIYMSASRAPLEHAHAPTQGACTSHCTPISTEADGTQID